MASDITLAVGDGSSRMTYAQLAEARNISLPAARRLTLRHHWHKQVGNDGVVIVSVPLSALQKPERPMTFRDPGTRPRSVSWDDAASDGGADIVGDPAVRALEHAVEALCAQLHRSEQWVVALRAELSEAHAAGRKVFESLHKRGERQHAAVKRNDQWRRKQCGYLVSNRPDHFQFRPVHSRIDRRHRLV